MSYIDFKSTVLQLNNWIIIRLPKYVSEQLPSRGMVMIEGMMNGVNFITPLEPDGMGSHWFIVNEPMCKLVGLKVSDTISLSVRPTKNWIEPEVPDDLKSSIRSFNVQNQWDKITTKARWEWIRWIRSTGNPQTREKRIITACSMLENGKKRPCCFDHSKCTEPSVSKNGILQIV